jgi:spermidine/putrescine transport system substrate-binding protein
MVSRETHLYGIKSRVSPAQWVLRLFQRRSFYYVLVLSFIFGILWGVGYRSAFLKPGMAPFSSKKSIRVLALENTFPQDVIEGFQTHSKIEVRLYPQKTAQALLERVLEKPFDVIVFKSYLAASLLKQNQIAKIDHTLVKNWSQISKDFLGLSFDPNNEFFVPFGWGIMGFMFPVEKWATIPKFNRDFLNPNIETKVFLSQRDEDLLFLAERKLNLQKYDDEKLKIAVQSEFDRLKKTAREPTAVDSSKFVLPPIDKETPMAYFISHGEAYTLLEKNKDWRFTVPEDGTLLWTLNFAVATASPEPALAYEFIDYMLSPEVAPDLARLRNVATTVVNHGTQLPDHLQPTYLKKLQLHSLTLARGRDSN